MYALQHGTGPHTWGGLIGIYDYPALRDGGSVTSLRLTIFSPDSAREVEDEEMAPDIEVEMMPRAVADGQNPQLERAVALVLAKLEARSCSAEGKARFGPACCRIVSDNRTCSGQ